MRSKSCKHCIRDIRSASLAARISFTRDPLPEFDALRRKRHKPSADAVVLRAEESVANAAKVVGKGASGMNGYRDHEPVRVPRALSNHGPLLLHSVDRMLSANTRAPKFFVEQGFSRVCTASKGRENARQSLVGPVS